MVCWTSSGRQLNRRVATASEGSVPCPAALSDEVSECHLVQRRMCRRIHQQLLVLPLEESYCCFCSIWPRSGPSRWHGLHSMCFPEHHPGRGKEGHIRYHPLWLTRMNMHPLSKQVLCHRLCALLLGSSPQKTRGLSVARRYSTPVSGSRSRSRSSLSL